MSEGGDTTNDTSSELKECLSYDIYTPQLVSNQFQQLWKDDMKQAFMSEVGDTERKIQSNLRAKVNIEYID